METMTNLEQMVDRIGLASVLDALAEVCHAKALQVWNDTRNETLSEEWTKAGYKLEMQADSLAQSATGIARNV